MLGNNEYNQNIGTRLKNFRERFNIKMPAIAAFTGLAKETLYKWEKGTNPRDVNDYFKLKAYLDKMENKLEEYQMELEDQKPFTVLLPFNSNKPPVYDTDRRGVTGTIVIANDEHYLIVERMSVPHLGPVDGAVEITGNSMEPTIKNGCRIAINRLRDSRILDPGRYYYIVNKNFKGIARRVYLCEGGLQLVSDNIDQTLFPPIERSWDQILAVFEIVGITGKL